jgi:hypothetical protein
MGGGQGVRYADQQLDDLPPVPGAARRPVPQRAAIHELRDEVLPAADIADVMNGQDVRVIERHPCFLLEATAVRLVGDLEDLDRISAAQPGVLGTVDLADSAARDRPASTLRRPSSKGGVRSRPATVQ